MAKEQPGTGRIFTRHAEPQPVPDREPPAPGALVASALARMAGMLSDMRRIAEDRSRPVDEYIAQTLTAASVTALQVPPQFEIPERIESVLITGPTGACSLQLGDRNWALTIPVSGVLLISPVSLLLNRNDNRILSSATPGAYFLELMGWADERY